MCFELAPKHELLLVDCSIQLGRPQRRLSSLNLVLVRGTV